MADEEEQLLWDDEEAEQGDAGGNEYGDLLGLDQEEQEAEASKTMMDDEPASNGQQQDAATKQQEQPQQASSQGNGNQQQQQEEPKRRFPPARIKPPEGTQPKLNAALGSKPQQHKQDVAKPAPPSGRPPLQLQSQGGRGAGGRRRIRYFNIRSFNQENIDISVQASGWATTKINEQRLEEAYKTSDEVRLIFAVNGTYHFQGYAVMRTPVGQYPGKLTWSNGKAFGSAFGIEWKLFHPLPFDKTDHLHNPMNENKPVRVARDGTEIPQDVGDQLIAIMEQHARENNALPPPKSGPPMGGAGRGMGRGADGGRGRGRGGMQAGRGAMQTGPGMGMGGMQGSMGMQGNAPMGMMQGPMQGGMGNPMMTGMGPNPMMMSAMPPQGPNPMMGGPMMTPSPSMMNTPTPPPIMNGSGMVGGAPTGIPSRMQGMASSMQGSMGAGMQGVEVSGPARSMGTSGRVRSRSPPARGGMSHMNGDHFLDGGRADRERQRDSTANEPDLLSMSYEEYLEYYRKIHRKMDSLNQAKQQGGGFGTGGMQMQQPIQQQQQQVAQRQQMPVQQQPMNMMQQPMGMQGMQTQQPMQQQMVPQQPQQMGGMMGNMNMNPMGMQQMGMGMNPMQGGMMNPMQPMQGNMTGMNMPGMNAMQMGPGMSMMQGGMNPMGMSANMMGGMQGQGMPMMGGNLGMMQGGNAGMMQGQAGNAMMGNVGGAQSKPFTEEEYIQFTLQHFQRQGQQPPDIEFIRQHYRQQKQSLGM